MAEVKSGSVGLLNDFDSNTAGTAYAYRTPEGYGADYGLFGRMGDKLLGVNHAAESAAAVYNAEIQNKFNSDEAQKNRDFQEYMSSTAYQRMMADAKKAGINPYYLVNGGSSGSSSPSGSSASSSGSPNFGSSGNKNVMGNLAASALAIAKLIAIFA